MDIGIIKNTIAELESADNTFENCAKLASLYIIRAEVEKTKLNTNKDAVEVELNDILPAYSYYVDAKRTYQLNGTSEEHVEKSLTILCQQVYEFIQALYSNTDMPKERNLIRNLIENVSEIV